MLEVPFKRPYRLTVKHLSFTHVRVNLNLPITHAVLEVSCVLGSSLKDTRTTALSFTHASVPPLRALARLTAKT